MKNTQFWSAIGAGGLALSVTACGSVPDSVSNLPREDRFGDRGAQVFARDYEMCANLVESRRALMAGCLAARGWSLNVEPPL